VFLFLIGILVYMEATKPQPLNWFPSYHKADKIPLGTYALHTLLKNNFKDNFKEQDRPPFEVLKDSTIKGTYIFINDKIDFDKSELEKMMTWVSKGNTVFISANFLGYTIKDTFNLETQTTWLSSTIGTKPLLNLVNKNLKSEKPYLIERDLNVRHFEKIDTLSQIVLGVSQIYNDTLAIKKPNVNYIKIPLDKGFFYIHTQPEIFSNYFILTENNALHTQNVLSYINDTKTVMWDNHYKSGKPIHISPLYILLNNKYLKWAYYFVLIGVLLFVLFEGKRKQRSIPIVQPLTNKTYQYTQVIAGMYLDKNEYHEIALKQISLFMEYIRTRLRVQTNKIDSHFINTISARSGNTFEETKTLFTFIEKIQNQTNTSKLELLKLHKEITEYKKKTDGKS